MAQLLSNDQLQSAHGSQGWKEQGVPRLLQPGVDYTPLALADADGAFKAISKAMDQGVDSMNDRPDDQENPFVPAIYTYFGQFVDHDLTLDTASNLADATKDPNNERTPRLDLDCLYGQGPDSGAFMYDRDGKLATNLDNPYDLPRAASPFDSGDRFSHRAIIGDPRNDENSIVCQLQLTLIHFHNAMIEHFKGQGLKGPKLFNRARQEVRYTYQTIVVKDFLKRIIQRDTYNGFDNDYNTLGAAAFKLYKPGPQRVGLPLEFTGAAYRFGHSGVRNAYRLNKDFRSLVFDDDQAPSQTLVGFGDLPKNHVIEWSLLVSNAKAPGELFENPDFSDPDQKNPKRLQFAYKLDTTLVDPLAHLPLRIAGDDVGTTFASLAARNLKRGYNFRLPSGQVVAAVIGAAPPLLQIGDKLLKFIDADPKKQIPGLTAADAAALNADTPLWLYVLAEAQMGMLTTEGAYPTKTIDGEIVIAKDPEVGTQLGPVGGRILMEVFYGVLADDPESVFQQSGWTPVVTTSGGALTLWDVLNYIQAFGAPGA